MAPGSLVFWAPAKINLTLEVLAQRSDGFHGIRSVMVPLDLADELRIEPGERFTFACDRADLAGDDNLALRALRALGIDPPCRLELRKRIPVEAGLGGGSSDAAAVLRAAMEGAFGPPPALDWLHVARTLGSDVPFFLAGTGALVEGTGERVTPVGALPPWHVLVIKPPVNVSTARAYALLDGREPPQRTRRTSISIEMLAALQRNNFDEVEGLLHNDFQESISQQAPAIAHAIDALRSAGVRRPLLAGSGSCVFAMAEDRDSIDAIAGRVSLPAEYERFRTAFARTPDWRA
jgi:4-diphosphocytidyl-2-C-methyl-D-erythritol kinase